MARSLSLADRRSTEHALRYLILTIAAVVALLPLLWGLASSFKFTNELFGIPVRILPSSPTFANYVKTIEKGFDTFLLNSFGITSVSVMFTLLMATVAAYALARFKFRGRGVILWMVLITMMVPGLASLIPTYMIMSRLKLVDSYAGLMLAYTALNLPLGVWILRSFFLTLPRELEQAAVIDGCGPFRTFALVMLPLAQPGIAAVAILGFLMAWNDHLIALTLVSSKALRTIPLALYYTLGDHGTDWGILTSGAILSVIPTILVYLALQKKFVSGLTAGAIKS